MKRIQLPVILLGILCAVIWLGCGDDDDDDDSNDTGNGTLTIDGDKVDIVGTWKLVTFEPRVVDAGPLPEQTFTFKPDGTWNSITVSRIPGLGNFTLTVEGTYTITGDRVIGQTIARRTETDFDIPGFEIPVTTPSGIEGETTVKREENRLTIIYKDEPTGQTTTVIYEKQ